MKDCRFLEEHIVATFADPGLRRKLDRLFEGEPGEQARQEFLELTVQKLKISEGFGALSRQISACLS